MTPYILLAIYYTFLLPFNSKIISSRKKAFFTIALVLPFFILLAFRSTNVGADTYPYSYTYERISSFGSLKEAIGGSYMEIGYSFLEFVFGRFGFSYFAFQIIVSFFFCLSLFIFIFKRSNNPPLICLLLLSMQVFFGMMNQTRMWMAACILLFSYAYAYKGHFFKFLFIVLAASFIHLSAIIFLFVYPFYHFYIRQKNLSILCLLVLSAFICISGKHFFGAISSLLGRYETFSNDSFYGFRMASALFFIEYAFAYFMVYRHNTKNALLIYENRSFVSSLPCSHTISDLDECICFIVVAISLAGLTNTFMIRITSLFLIFLCASFSNVVIDLRNKNTRLAFYIALIVVLFSQMLLILVYRPEWDSVVPYEFFNN